MKETSIHIPVQIFSDSHALEVKDAQLFEGVFERLQKSSHKMAEALYRSAAGAAGGPDVPPAGDGAPAGGGEGKKDDVIDAEYTEGPKT